MKTTLFTFLFLISLSYFAFGQVDSLSFEERLLLRTRDCAHSHICCQVACPCCPNYGKIDLNVKPVSDSLPHISFGQDSLVGIKGLTFEEINKQVDTIFTKENKYVLSKADKDSIFNSVYLQEKTQQLLESYNIGNNKDIFLADNHLSFLSILNSNLVQYDTKRDFLINRIKHDEKTIITKSRNIITHSDRISPAQSNTTNHKQPVRIKQPYYSKDETIAQFLNKQKVNEYVDFSYAYYLFIEIDYSKEQPIQNIELPSYKKSGSGTKLPSLKNTTRKINKTRIVAIDCFPNYVSFPLGHATTESVNQIIIYYER